MFDLVTPMPYVELQKLLDEANAWGSSCYDKGVYVRDLSDPVIEIITEHVPGKASPLSALLLYRLDGAYSRVGDEETAFSGGRSSIKAEYDPDNTFHLNANIPPG